MIQNIIRYLILLCFFVNNCITLAHSGLETSKSYNLITTSENITPIQFTGIKIYPDQPFVLDFIVNNNKQQNINEIKAQSQKMAKYFLAALTIPESELWVNLSPYEKEKIISPLVSKTVLATTLLEEDYLLKQLSSSLLNPESEIGKTFWKNVYSQALKVNGTTQINVNTYNKVWILPDIVKVYQQNNAAYITKSHLKVSLDQDYLAQKKMSSLKVDALKDQHQEFSNQQYRQIILPVIEREVNEGKSFARLRQMFHALILAKWYKEKVKNALLKRVFENKGLVKGVDINDPDLKERVFRKYVQMYKKGAFDFIKEENVEGKIAVKKYFSGGVVINVNIKDDENKPSSLQSQAMIIRVNLKPIKDQAMNIGSIKVPRVNLEISKPLNSNELVSKIIERWNALSNKDQNLWFTEILGGNSNLERIKTLPIIELNLAEKSKRYEWRDINVSTDDAGTHLLLEKMGFEQDPNNLTLIRSLRDILKKNDPTITSLEENSDQKTRLFKITFQKPFKNLGDNKEIKVFFDNAIGKHDVLNEIDRGDFRVLLPKTTWTLKENGVDDFSKKTGIEKSKIYYAGRNAIEIQALLEKAKNIEADKVRSEQDKKAKENKEQERIKSFNEWNVVQQARINEQLAQKREMEKARKKAELISRLKKYGLLSTISVAVGAVFFVSTINPNSNSRKSNLTVPRPTPSIKSLPGIELNNPSIVDEMNTVDNMKRELALLKEKDKDNTLEMFQSLQKIYFFITRINNYRETLSASAQDGLFKNVLSVYESGLYQDDERVMNLMKDIFAVLVSPNNQNPSPQAILWLKGEKIKFSKDQNNGKKKFLDEIENRSLQVLKSIEAYQEDERKYFQFIIQFRKSNQWVDELRNFKEVLGDEFFKKNNGQKQDINRDLFKDRAFRQFIFGLFVLRSQKDILFLMKALDLDSDSFLAFSLVLQYESLKYVDDRDLYDFILIADTAPNNLIMQAVTYAYINIYVSKVLKSDEEINDFVKKNNPFLTNTLLSNLNNLTYQRIKLIRQVLAANPNVFRDKQGEVKLLIEQLKIIQKSPDKDLAKEAVNLLKILSPNQAMVVNGGIDFENITIEQSGNSSLDQIVGFNLDIRDDDFKGLLGFSPVVTRVLGVDSLLTLF